MPCPICQEACAMEECTLTQCGHVFHRRCLSLWWREGGDCPLCRAPIPEEETLGPDPVHLSADTLDDLLLSLAALLDDGALASKVVLSAAPPDAAFTHSVHAAFHRLFDPDHARELPVRLPRSPLVTRLLLATQPVLDTLLRPPQFKKAKRDV